MSNSLAPLRELPRATRWIASVLVALISIITSLSACIVYAQSFVRDDELDKTFAAHRLQHIEERDAHQEEERKSAKAQLDRDSALFRRLVSLEAADIEPDRRRAAAAAAHARTAYDVARTRGMEPALAAQYAIDDRPPWRK